MGKKLTGNAQDKRTTMPHSFIQFSLSFEFFVRIFFQFEFRCILCEFLNGKTWSLDQEWIK